MLLTRLNVLIIYYTYICTTYPLYMNSKFRNSEYIDIDIDTRIVHKECNTWIILSLIKSPHKYRRWWSPTDDDVTEN